MIFLIIFATILSKTFVSNKNACFFYCYVKCSYFLHKPQQHVPHTITAKSAFPDNPVEKGSKNHRETFPYYIVGQRFTIAPSGLEKTFRSGFSESSGKNSLSWRLLSGRKIFVSPDVSYPSVGKSITGKAVDFSTISWRPTRKGREKKRHTIPGFPAIFRELPGLSCLKKEKKRFAKTTSYSSCFPCEPKKKITESFLL